MANKINDTSELKQYQKNYSESGLWKKIGEVAKKAGSNVIYLALVLYYVLKSPDVSVGNKSIIIGALGYFILPLDLIPDVIPIMGFTDDLAALTLAYKAVKASVTPRVEAQAKQKLSQWFS